MKKAKKKASVRGERRFRPRPIRITRIPADRAVTLPPPEAPSTTRYWKLPE